MDGTNTPAADGTIDFEALREKYAQERAKRLRVEADAQYRPATGHLGRFTKDTHVQADHREPRSARSDVVVIGSGFSGLLTAARLRERGFENITIIDKSGDFGGTWYWNRYPGAACDIESYIYMPLLEETGYMPSEKYASAREIFAYAQRLGHHFDLYRGALFQTTVTSLAWNEEELHWLVTTDRGDSITAPHVIIAGGFLSQPKLPGIAGIETFAGYSFHTSRWDYQYTGGTDRGNLTGLADKRVGLIGTGATALQCVPFLAAAAKHLYIFQRTPSSIDERGNQPTDPAWARGLKPGWQRQRMENFNNILSGIPVSEDLVSDSWTRVVSPAAKAEGLEGAPEQMPEINELLKMENVRRRIDATVRDPKTAEALKPYYNYFCKRPGFNDEYLECFNRDNVTLVDTMGQGVDRIGKQGPVVQGVEYPIDCLIYATGFEYLTEFASQAGMEITGRDGLRLSDKWKQGTRTFYGMHSRGFPNLHILGFAQTGMPWNYTQLAHERAGHLAYILDACRKQGVATIEPTQEAEDAWVNEVLALRGPRKAFYDTCTPSYYNLEGAESEAAALNDIYGGGGIAFFKILSDWREEDALRGMEITPSTPGNR